MELIHLPRGEWFYDPTEQLGPEGGFGVVFVGEGKNTGPVAVKRLKVSANETAHRELRIAEELAGQSFRHVIPVYDAGVDEATGYYFVVMAKADRSLQEELKSRQRFDDTAAADVMAQIAHGLSEVGQLVHRDLKPGNVLLHDGAWKVADFGIARFVEESTAINTVKNCLSPHYAAPEQWRLERSTGATDVYALGCIGYALLTGEPPFHGPSSEDFSDQHQHLPAPPLDGRNAQIRSLLAMMLRKSPDARPSIARVISLLSTVVARESGVEEFSALAEAGASVAQREAANEARKTTAEVREAARARLVEDALASLRRIGEELIERIIRVAPAAKRLGSGYGVLLGDAELRLTLPKEPLPAGTFRRSSWDVLIGATIGVRQAKPHYEWNASLWYARLEPGEDYRWYEVSYFVNPLKQSHLGYEFAPFALTHEPRHADEAAGPGIATFCIASGPDAIDDEDIGAFCRKWAGLLAKATEGKISYPRSLPLR